MGNDQRAVKFRDRKFKIRRWRMFEPLRSRYRGSFYLGPNIELVEPALGQPSALGYIL